jgi:hypothetical protein
VVLAVAIVSLLLVGCDKIPDRAGLTCILSHYLNPNGLGPAAFFAGHDRLVAQNRIRFPDLSKLKPTELSTATAAPLFQDCVLM